MTEVYLYRCDRCGTVIALDNDRGHKFYIDDCSACKHWADFEKIVLGPAYDMFGVFQGHRFTLEEKKDGNSDTRTNKET